MAAIPEIAQMAPERFAASVLAQPRLPATSRMTSDTDLLPALLFTGTLVVGLAAGVGVGLVYRWKYLNQRPSGQESLTRSESAVVWLGLFGCLIVVAAILAIRPIRSAVTGKVSTYILLTGLLFFAILFGWLVRRRNRRLGLVPPPPKFENADNPPRGWEWDGTRWRRVRT